MGKILLSLASIAAALLLGCSADGFFNEGSDSVSAWGKVCKTATGCAPVQSRSQCDARNGTLVMRSECSGG